nr:hypothetical protein [Tanacetum cinerariifolium]
APAAPRSCAAAGRYPGAPAGRSGIGRCAGRGPGPSGGAPRPARRQSRRRGGAPGYRAAEKHSSKAVASRPARAGGGGSAGPAARGPA